MSNREKVKMFARELLKAWDINLGVMYWNVIDNKINSLSEEKLEKSIELIKEFF